MILLVGNNHDDVLYFETRMTEKTVETVYKKYRVVVGNIAGQRVVLVENVYTNIVSSLIVSYLIEKYTILFVIKIGKALTATKKLKNGDVTVSRKVIASDVNVSDLQGTELGQIPGFATAFETSYDLAMMFVKAFEQYSFADVKLVSVVSSNVHQHSLDSLKDLIHEDHILTESIDSTIFDSEAYGIGYACSLHDIPFCCINVILNHVGEKFSADNYIRVLNKYSVVGKAVTSIISGFADNDVLRD